MFAPKGGLYPPALRHWAVADTLRPMKMPRLFLAIAACIVSLNAAAQWQWIDKDGRKVFSDRPPPSDISEDNILKEPRGRRAKAATAASDTTVAQPSGASASTPAPTPAVKASAARPSGKDKELEKKKAQAEAEEAAKQQMEQERASNLRADNCTRARRAKTAYESGQRVAQTNDKGERVLVDDATRAAEVKRLQSIIEANCN